MLSLLEASGIELYNCIEMRTSYTVTTEKDGNEAPPNSTTPIIIYQIIYLRSVLISDKIVSNVRH
jgi:hypothetical protein